MARCGIYTVTGVIFLVTALVLQVVGFSTRGWLSGSLLTSDFQAGLFQVTINGRTMASTDFFRSIPDELRTTIILEAIGTFFQLVTTLSMVIFMVRKDKSAWLILSYLCCTFISGPLQLAGTFYFSLNVQSDYISTIFTSLSYSWYLVVVSGFLTIFSVIPLGRAAKTGEWDTARAVDRAVDQVIINSKAPTSYSTNPASTESSSYAYVTENPPSYWNPVGGAPPPYTREAQSY